MADKVVAIPPDGAAKRFKASQENAALHKQQLVVRGTDLRKKIEIANCLKALWEHPGWKLVTAFYTKKWDFTAIMNEFRHGKDPESYKHMMIQREALSIIEDWMRNRVHDGEAAQAELGELEKQHK